MQKRESGIDLLRCFALLCVNGVHGFLYNGFYFEDQVGALMWSADAARWLFYCCNCLFMMITGYLRSGKPMQKGYYRSLLPILVGYVLTCLISFPIRHFIQGEKLSLMEWVTKLVTFGNYGWYVEMYIGLFLLSPIINIVLERMKNLQQYCWLLGTMLFLTALPSITSIDFIPDYWSSLYPVTLYILGAGIRRFRPNVKWWVAGLLTLAVQALQATFSILTTDGDFTDGYTQGYGGFWTTLTGLGVFLTLYQFQLNDRWAARVKWMAGGVFEGFLLSRLFDTWAYGAAPKFFRTPEYYWLGFLLITLPIYLFSIVAGNVVHALAVKLCSLKLPKKQPATTE